MKNKNIILVDAYGLNGGAEKVMLNTYNALNENNNTFCAVPVSSVIKEMIGVSDLILFNSVFDLILKIKKISPEIIILNNKLALKFLIPLKIFFSRAKFIYHSHTFFRKKFELFIYQSFFIKFLNKTVCVSESLKKNHSNNFISHKHVVVYNGFDFKIKNDNRKISDDKINIFFWAQFREWKGHLFLIKVIKNINKENVKFHFVANIQDNESRRLYKALNLQIAKLGLNEFIEFHLDIPNHLGFIKNNAQIALSCSTLKDPLPTILIESLSLGIPILSTNLGGSTEILRAFPNFLSSSNIDEFSEKLNYIINNLDSYSSKQITDEFENRFRLNNYNKKIINLIETLN